MEIKHGNKTYRIYIRMLSSVNSNNLFYLNNKNSFDELMALEYPEVDISKFNEYYTKLIDEISLYAAFSSNPYKEEWECIYIFFGIVNNKLIFGRYQQTVADRMMEQSEKNKGLYDGLLCKIDTYGWLVTQENGYTKVSYYTRTDDENKTIYPIYVYKDMLILSNADEDKPSIVKNEYFLYNAGERKKS